MEKKIFEWPAGAELGELIGANPVGLNSSARFYGAGGGDCSAAVNSASDCHIQAGRVSSGGRKRKLSSGGKCKVEEEEYSAKKCRSEEAKGAGQSLSGDKSSKPADPSKQDFIHVRARRGQATDSHSLAERVRREKISQRMKFLQDLVPGCNKVTGKAVMLDEIINYVQSLQRQVEFLSMKLATVNPRLDLNIESLLSKDPPSSLPQSSYPFDILTAGGFPFSSPPPPPPLSLLPPTQQQDQHQGQFSLNPMDSFPHAPSQLAALWDDNLHGFGHLAFHQSPEAFSSSSQSFHD